MAVLATAQGIRAPGPVRTGCAPIPRAAARTATQVNDAGPAPDRTGPGAHIPCAVARTATQLGNAGPAPATSAKLEPEPERSSTDWIMIYLSVPRAVLKFCKCGVCMKERQGGLARSCAAAAALLVDVFPCTRGGHCFGCAAGFALGVSQSSQYTFRSGSRPANCRSSTD